MQEGIIENFGKIDRLNIMLKSTYTGYIPIEELLLHLDCEKASIWYDWQRDEEESVATLISYEESKEWKIKEKLMELLSDTKRQLKAVYRLLVDKYWIFLIHSPIVLLYLSSVTTLSLKECA